MIVAGCAQLEANKHFPGTLTADTFTPTRPAASNYGPDASRTCAAGGPTKVTADVVEAAAKKDNKPVPKLDGRLCAMADTLLGWDAADLPTTTVLALLSAYFGLESPVRRFTLTSMHTEDAGGMADSLASTIGGFADGATQPTFGLATVRLHKGETRVALMMRDAQFDLDPLPRALPLKGTTVLNGHLAGALQNPKVLYSNPTGKLETAKLAPGKDFHVELSCGERPGLLLVEIRAEDAGSETSLATLPIACGTELAASVPVKVTAQGPLDAAAEEKKVFEMINAARTAVGLGALAPDPAVAGVARSISQAFAAHNSAPDVIAALKQADIVTPVVTENGGEARSGEDMQARFALSPTLRANYLATDVSHVGVGAVLSTGSEGKPSIIVTELFVRELPPIDVEDARGKLRAALATKRSDARAPALEAEPLLDQVATAYAQELVATKGKPPKERTDAIFAPLNKPFISVNQLAVVKDKIPTDMAEDPLVVSGGNFSGVGVAQGMHPVYGKNAIYAVVLIGKKRPEPEAHPKGHKKH